MRTCGEPKRNDTVNRGNGKSYLNFFFCVISVLLIFIMREREREREEFFIR
jgi:hypothetical protein